MEYRKMEGTWVLVLKRGERIIEKLGEFVNKENVRSGHFTAVGAVDDIELAHYNLEKKQYSTLRLKQPLEVVSLMGNVSVKGDEKIIHGHIVVGTDEMKLYGGHLKEATVAVTCEIIFNELAGTVTKKPDPETGLNLMNFG